MYPLNDKDLVKLQELKSQRSVNWVTTYNADSGLPSSLYQSIHSNSPCGILASDCNNHMGRSSSGCGADIGGSQCGC